MGETQLFFIKTAVLFSCSEIQKVSPEFLKPCSIPLRHRNMSPKPPATNLQAHRSRAGLDGDWADNL